MTHPLIPSLLELATPIAETLGFEVAGAVFYTNQSPPVLRVDIRNPATDTSLEDCEAMSHALGTALEASDLIPDAYVLEISSPGVPESLTTDREFTSFKGFPVVVTVQEPYKGHTTWNGQLIRRDEAAVHLSQKGRAVAIPRSLILSVQLDDHPQSS
ncbi:ribosome maturation factor RimP [Vacuolonema iberomarrocanum]|uniref:ribosome maturation factor RimP n=1 Tax=Vacuolonema iberomarrocanum TaxID=3454632 RepID=UPI0019ED0651|nr:ribosome maturation factor RimP [filamentous cyanobacterium LEGE 07170]